MGVIQFLIIMVVGGHLLYLFYLLFIRLPYETIRGWLKNPDPLTSDEAYELRENIIWAEELGLSKDSTEFLIRQIRAKIHAKYHHPDRYQILMATK